MSGSTTPNYNFQLPTISGDQNTWGNKLNSNWSSLDTLIHNLVVAAGGSSATSLPLTGGTLTGPLQVNSNLGVSGYTTLANATIANLTVSSNLAVSGNTATAGTALFAYPTISDFSIYRNSSNQRVIQFATGVTEVFDIPSSSIYWNMQTPKMHLDYGGNLTLTGVGYQPGGGPWFMASDDRMKRNVTPYTAGLDAVCALTPIAFQYNGQGDVAADGKTYYGVSAQKTRAVMPELVAEMPRSEKRLPGQLATGLGPLLLAACNAIRELRDRVVALEMQLGA